MSKKKIFEITNEGDIPRFGKKISWKDISNGFIFKTVHETYGENNFELVNYCSKTTKLTLKYDKKMLKPIEVKHFRSGHIGALIGKVTKDFKIEIATPFKDDKRDLIITDREYRRRKHSSSDSIINQKWYKYTCNKCGWTEGWMVEGNLLGSKTKNPQGCACCCNPPQVVVPEINSIWVKAKWMTKWISEEDAKKYTSCSNKRINVTCYDCGRSKNMMILDIYRRKSIDCTCSCCGFSYPEKFMHNVLMQTGIEFETQYSPKWAKGKRYDFCIPSLNTIIETHGIQHYQKSKRGRTLQEEQENDKLKRKLALSNKVKNYIVIDCRYSDFEYIKENILNSKLNELFDLSKIDWLKAEEFALGNLVKEVCDYWKNKEEWETTADLSKIFKLSLDSVRSYLKKGVKLNWCNYDSIKEVKNSWFKPQNTHV